MLSEVLQELHWEQSHGGTPWLNSLSEVPADPIEQAQRVIEAIGEVGRALERLHSVDYVLTGFSLELLMKTESGLRIRSLQSNITRKGKIPANQSVSPSYSAPEIVEPSPVSPATDVFHLAALFYGLATRKAPQGTTIEGLRSCRYHLPRFRIYDPTFPVGFEAIWRKAMSANPGKRYQAVTEFLDELKETLEQLRKNASGETTLKFDVGMGTEIGEVKKLRCAENQDAIFPDPGQGESSRIAELRRDVFAIADGVSRCDYGSGDMASGIVIKWVKRAVEKYVKPAEEESPDWEVEEVFKTLSQVVVQATHEIAETAPTAEEARPEKVMSSTLLAAIVKNHNVLVGNTGNSRAFIVGKGYIEQINLDDDVWHARLRSGMPPEEARNKKGNSLLRRVVGACMRDSGKIISDLRRVRFTGYRAYLGPGDLLLLCSDGLVDEGSFISPREAFELVRTNIDKSAQEICDILIDEANARQIPPNHGDNISCIIVKVQG
ncbi:MAG: protein phosphatase 2C domain-containing protein [Planctomycetota bacterium]|nr:protein phosphatase 2C domain-containing protein [Planctomycetota bacterium]MDA1141542.1 protein phosphatase 2C domain-containing protein [Planctomycetota bacterium]